MPGELRPVRGDLDDLRIERGDEESAPSRRIWPWVLLGLALLAAAIGYFLWKNVWSLPLVQTARAIWIAPEQSRIVLTTSGYIAPRRKAAIGAKISGKLEKLLVDEGSVVKEGELLAQIDNRDYRARRNEAQANLADAKRELERQTNLHASGVGAKQKVDEQETRVGVFAAQLELAEVNLQYSRVTAPFDGIVIQKQMEVGEIVSPGVQSGSISTGSILVLASIEIEAEADVNETNLNKVFVGQDAEVAVDAIPGRIFRGKVRLIEPKADRQKAIIQAKVAIPDAGDDLRPDMGAKISFIALDSKSSPALGYVQAPASAIVERLGTKAVFLLQGERVVLRNIEIGAIEGSVARIQKGLTGNETLILAPTPDLQDGARVRVSR